MKCFWYKYKSFQIQPGHIKQNEASFWNQSNVCCWLILLTWAAFKIYKCKKSQKRFWSQRARKGQPTHCPPPPPLTKKQLETIFPTGIKPMSFQNIKFWMQRCEPVTKQLKADWQQKLFQMHWQTNFNISEKIAFRNLVQNIYETTKILEIRLADISSLLVKDFVKATDQAARAVTIYALIGNVRRSTVKIREHMWAVTTVKIFAPNKINIEC